MTPEKLYLEMIENLCDGVYFVDPERRITFWNKAAEEITGYKKEEILGKCCQNNILNHIDKEGRPLCVLGCPLYSTILDGEQRKAEVFLRHKKGHRIPILVNIFPITEDGIVIGAVEIFTPKSPIVYDDDLVESLTGLAMNDQLTGLPNRKKIESYLEYRFLELQRFNSKFCVVFLDVDNFSAFNNTYGHETGDDVLKGLSRSIMHTIRKDDIFGRWGGEEFVGVFKVNHENEIKLIGEKIRILVSGTQLAYETGNLSVTASIGVALARLDDTIDSVVKRADALMYQSKENGKDRVSYDI